MVAAEQRAQSPTVQSFVPQGAGEGWPVHIYTELTVPNLKQGLLNEEGEKTN